VLFFQLFRYLLSTALVYQSAFMNIELVSLPFTDFRSWALDWIEQCFTSPPTQYMLYGRRFLQVKRPNQQYQKYWRNR